MKLLRIEDDDHSYTRFVTPVPASGYAAQTLSRLQERTALRVIDDPVTGTRFETIDFSRIVPSGRVLALEGPDVHLTDLSDCITDSARSGGRTIPVGLLVRGLLAIIEQRFTLPLCTSLLFLDDQNRIVFLSTELAALVRENMAVEEVFSDCSRYDNTTLSGTEREVFFVTALVYHVLTGFPPYGDTAYENREEVERALSRPTGIAPIRTFRPTLRPDIADLIDDIITGTRERTIPSLRLLVNAVQSDEVLDRTLTEAAAEIEQNSAREVFERRNRQRERREFFRRHGTQVTIVLVAAVVILAIPFQIVRNAIADPTTAGLGPTAVVQTFYQAWSDLDHELLSETLGKKVATDRIREISNLYVIDRVQQAYGRQSNIVSAQEWLSAGEPPDVLPYGITDLSVELQTEDANRAVLVARYRYFYPDTQDDGTYVIIEQRHEVLNLENRGRYWEITSVTPDVEESSRRFLAGTGER